MKFLSATTMLSAAAALSVAHAAATIGARDLHSFPATLDPEALSRDLTSFYPAKTRRATVLFAPCVTTADCTVTPNSICDVTQDRCACNTVAGYVQDPTKTLPLCVTRQQACINLCVAKDANSECAVPATANKCRCKKAFVYNRQSKKCVPAKPAAPPKPEPDNSGATASTATSTATLSAGNGGNSSTTTTTTTTNNNAGGTVSSSAEVTGVTSFVGACRDSDCDKVYGPGAVCRRQTASDQNCVCKDPTFFIPTTGKQQCRKFMVDDCTAVCKETYKGDIACSISNPTPTMIMCLCANPAHFMDPGTKTCIDLTSGGMSGRRGAE